MRRVAEELGTGAASLYAHVANKDELLELVHDRIMGEIEVPAPDPAHWQDQLREIAMQSFRVYTSHRDIARVSLANVPTGPNALRIAEGMARHHAGRGRAATGRGVRAGPARALHRRRRLRGHALSQALAESGLSREDFMESYFGSVREFFQNLPADRFPLLTTHVDELMDGDSEQRFEFGLDMLIRSLGTYAANDLGARDPDLGRQPHP